MKSLILAAGFATSLSPLTKTFPKPLLEVGDKTILDRLLTDVDALETIKEHIIVTNDSFYPYYKAWLARTHYKKPINLINDGVLCNENCKSAVCDLLYVIEKLSIKDDLLVLSGDMVVDFSFKGLVEMAQSKGCSCVSCYKEHSQSELQKASVLVLNNEHRVIALIEKPEVPPTNWALSPIYCFLGADVDRLYKAVVNGYGFEMTSHLVMWLQNHVEVNAWELPGQWYSICDVASYETADKLFKQTQT